MGWDRFLSMALANRRSAVTLIKEGIEKDDEIQVRQAWEILCEIEESIRGDKELEETLEEFKKNVYTDFVEIEEVRKWIENYLRQKRASIQKKKKKSSKKGKK